MATTADVEFLVNSQVQMAFETENMQLNTAVVRQGVQAIFHDPLKGFYIVSENSHYAGEHAHSQKDSEHAHIVGAYAHAGEHAHSQKEHGVSLCSCLMITPEWSDWRNNWVWWIQSVYVVPEFRKSGIFGMMYDYIKSMVMQRPDIAGIRLYVDNSNHNAREVYRKVGMTDQHYRLFEWMK